MMQIFMALVGLITVAGIGFAVNERLVVEHLNQQATENIRRLDRAARALEANLYIVPGTDVMSPIVPQWSASHNTLPTSIGVDNRTSLGSNFFYCPIGGVAQSLVDATGTVETRVVKAGSEYTIRLRGDRVLNSTLALHSSWNGQPQPLAFLILRGRNAGAPDCAQVEYSNGKPIVANGLVRAIYAPSDPLRASAHSSGQDIRSSAMYVTSTGKGRGTNWDDPASIGSALTYFIQNRPERFTLMMGDTVGVSPDLWNSFASALRGSGAEIGLIGKSAGVGGLVVETSGFVTWQFKGNQVTIENMIFDHIQFRPTAGSSLTLLGVNTLQDTSNTAGSLIDVYEGGSATVKGTLWVLNNPNNIAIAVRGSFLAYDSMILTNDNKAGTLIYGIESGDITLLNVKLGDVGSRYRAKKYPLRYHSNGFLSMDSRTVAYRSIEYGVCWLVNETSPAFNYSDAAGSSAVKPYSSFAAHPGSGASQAAIDAWEAEQASVNYARELNQSSASCSA